MAAMGPRELALRNRSNGQMLRIADEVARIQGGEEINNPAVALQFGAEGNVSHTALAFRISDMPNAVNPRDELTGMTDALWNGMTRLQRADRLGECMELVYCPTRQLYGVRFYGGQAYFWFTKMTGLAETKQLTCQLKHHFDATITLQATIDSQEIERKMTSLGRYSLDNLATITVYHSSFTSLEDALAFRPQGRQNRRRNRNLERVRAEDREAQEALAIESSDEEEQPPRRRRRRGVEEEAVELESDDDESDDGSNGVSRFEANETGRGRAIVRPVFYGYDTSST